MICRRKDQVDPLIRLFFNDYLFLIICSMLCFLRRRDDKVNLLPWDNSCENHKHRTLETSFFFSTFLTHCFPIIVRSSVEGSYTTIKDTHLLRIIIIISSFTLWSTHHSIRCSVPFYIISKAKSLHHQTRRRRRNTFHDQVYGYVDNELMLLFVLLVSKQRCSQWYNMR